MSPWPSLTDLPPLFFTFQSILEISYLALGIEDQSTSCLIAFKNNFKYVFILVEKMKLGVVTLFEGH